MKNVVLLTHRILPPTGGDSLFNWGLLQELRNIASVQTFSLAQSDDIEAEGISFYPSNATDAAFDRRLFNDLCTYINSHDVDIVLISHVLMYKYLRPLKKACHNSKNIQWIYISHNAEYTNAVAVYDWTLSKMSGLKKVAYGFYSKFRLMALKRRERIMLTESSAYFSISDYDVEEHKKLYKNVVPSYTLKPLIEFPCTKQEEDYTQFHKKLLIVGSMGWYPNVKGAIWFCDNVMSQLVTEGYDLYIVGNQPDSSVQKLAEHYPGHIIVTGRVPTVDEYFELCDISIVPLFEGTGTKIKVLESIGRGILTVSTTFAAKDYHISNEIMLADTAEEFIDRIHRLENSEQLRKQQYRDMRAFYHAYNKLPAEIADLFR